MDEITPDSAADDHRRRELDFMRELEEQSGKRHPEDEGSGVIAAAEDRGADRAAPEEPRA